MMTTEQERQTAWDRQIVASLEKEISQIEMTIAGKSNSDFVRSLRGDARPMLVGAHRTTIQQKRREIDRITAEIAAAEQA